MNNFFSIILQSLGNVFSYNMLQALRVSDSLQAGTVFLSTLTTLRPTSLLRSVASSNRDLEKIWVKKIVYNHVLKRLCPTIIVDKAAVFVLV